MPFQGAVSDHRAGSLVSGDAVQPGLQRRHHPLGQEPVHGLRLWNGEERRATKTPVAKPGREVHAQVSERLRGHPVEDDGHRNAPVGCLLEHFPRHGIGVARCGRHEDPQVSGGQELHREVTVGLDQAVDVRRIDQGHARGQAFVRHEPKASDPGCVGVDRLQRLGTLGRDPVQLGQNPLRHEGARVVRVVNQHRRTRGRAKHA
jgi:hypothetical protein